MSRGSALVVGSGPAGSIAAAALGDAGYEVLVLERGRNLRPGLGQVPSGELGTLYSNDGVKHARHLGFPDPLLEPSTRRTQDEAAGGVPRSAQGLVAIMGSAVGGTSMLYAAKFPRFWRQDFHTLSELGPISGANLVDWPIAYEDLAPFYDEVEQIMGVQGDIHQMPERTLAQTPQRRQYPMPPNPIGYGARLLAQGARNLGYTAYPYPAAVNSVPFQGRPACNSCGRCAGFGCPIGARNNALVSVLNPALRRGRIRLRSRCFVHRINTTPDGRRATGVAYFDSKGGEREERADVVIIAGSPVQTARLLLLSANGPHPNGLGNRSGELGRNLMLHAFTLGGALFAQDDIHSIRALTTTLEMDDLVGPFQGPEVQATGLPWIKGGLVQVGGALPLLQEAQAYADLQSGYGGLAHKQLMKLSPMRLRVAGFQLVGEDLPQRANRVDLDPEVRDWQGIPVARVTYSPHQHERQAALLLGARLEAMALATPGAAAGAILPFPVLSDEAQDFFHQAGTARMGNDPDSSVCDGFGRVHEVDNLYIGDGSVFPTFPGFNPTLTIMAHSLRMARHIAGAAP